MENILHQVFAFANICPELDFPLLAQKWVRIKQDRLWLGVVTYNLGALFESDKEVFCALRQRCSGLNRACLNLVGLVSLPVNAALDFSLEMSGEARRHQRHLDVAMGAGFELSLKRLKAQIVSALLDKISPLIS